MEDKRVLILLVEGKTDAILYKSLIEKTLGSRVSDIEYLDYSIRMLLSKIEASRRNITTLEVSSDIVLVIVECRGYERLKGYLRELIYSDYFLESLGHGLAGFIIAADKDKNPHNSIQGVLASLKYSVLRDNNALKITIEEGRHFPIYVIEQGLDNGVKAVEDELDLLAEQLEPDIAKAIKAIEKILGTKLSSIQKLGIIEAIKVNNNGIYTLIPRLIEKARLEELKTKLSNQFRLINIIKKYLQANTNLDDIENKPLFY